MAVLDRQEFKLPAALEASQVVDSAGQSAHQSAPIRQCRDDHGARTPIARAQLDGGAASPAGASSTGVQATEPQRLPARQQSGATSGGSAFGAGKSQRWPDKGGGRFPKLIEGQGIASSTGIVSAFAVGDRVFHDKFGYGAVAEVDGNKLTVDFDKAGRKR